MLNFLGTAFLCILTAYRFGTAARNSGGAPRDRLLPAKPAAGLIVPLVAAAASPHPAGAVSARFARGVGGSAPDGLPPTPATNVSCNIRQIVNHISTIYH